MRLTDRGTTGRVVAPGARRVLLAMVVLVAMTGPARAVQGDAERLLERQVKAALLYRFINYVEWPESAFKSPDAPFTIAIAGADLLAAELAAFAFGRRVLDRPLEVRRIRPGEPAKDVHIVFVGRQDAQRLGAILTSVPQNALIVTEWSQALEQGSIINFVLVEGRVRFEVSLDAAQKRNIRLSSRLLSVAHYVRP
jgi:hypothetical protein